MRGDRFRPARTWDTIERLTPRLPSARFTLRAMVANRRSSRNNRLILAGSFRSKFVLGFMGTPVINRC
jgi:hypothetical protein